MFLGFNLQMPDTSKYSAMWSSSCERHKSQLNII